jgi:hypothetical protein
VIVSAPARFRGDHGGSSGNFPSCWAALAAAKREMGTSWSRRG